MAFLIFLPKKNVSAPINRLILTSMWAQMHLAQRANSRPELRIGSQHSSSAHSCSGEKIPLGEYLIGGIPKLHEIFLPSQLSIDNKMRSPGIQPVFGGEASHQYIGCLADSSLIPFAEYKKNDFLLSWYESKEVICSKGFQIGGSIHFPINQRATTSRIRVCAGSLLCDPTTLLETGESSLTQFFSDFNNVDDFIQRAVLVPKNLSAQGYSYASLDSVQGFLWGSCHIESGCCQKIDSKLAFAGVGLEIPIDRSSNRCKIFSIEERNKALGFYGMVGCFLRTIFQAINPACMLIIEGFGSYNDQIRLPETVTEIDKTALPERFRPFIIEPFSFLNSQYSAFSDRAHHARIKNNARASCIIGNYFEPWRDAMSNLFIGYLVEYAGAEKIVCCSNSLSKIPNTPLGRRSIVQSILATTTINCMYGAVELGAIIPFALKNSIESPLVFAAVSIAF